LTPKMLYIGLFLGLCYAFAGKITIIHYNNTSAFFLIVSGVALVKSITSGGFAWALIGGMAVLLAGFARIPGILGIGMLMCIPYAILFLDLDLHKGLRIFLSYCIGVLAMLLIIVGIMYLMGHLELYHESLSLLFLKSSVHDSYGPFRMFTRFIRQNLQALLVGIGIISVAGLFSAVLATIDDSKHVIIKYFFFALIITTSFFVASRLSVRTGIWGLSGVCYLICGIPIFFPKRFGSERTLLAMVSICLLLALSVGSDTGLKVSSYGFTLSIPVVLAILSTSDSVFFQTEGRGRSVCAVVPVILIAIVLPLGGIDLYNGIYRDSHNRRLLTTGMTDSSLRGVYTTKTRAHLIDEAVAQLHNYVAPGDELITLESIGIFHYILRTRPYLHNPWPVLYEPDYFRQLLQKIEATTTSYPPMIRALHDTRSAWPNNGPLSSKREAVGVRNLMNDFIQRNRYEAVWNNDMFEILLPASTQSKHPRF